MKNEKRGRGFSDFLQKILFPDDEKGREDGDPVKGKYEFGPDFVSEKADSRGGGRQYAADPNGPDGLLFEQQTLHILLIDRFQHFYTQGVFCKIRLQKCCSDGHRKIYHPENNRLLKCLRVQNQPYQ